MPTSDIGNQIKFDCSKRWNDVCYANNTFSTNRFILNNLKLVKQKKMNAVMWTKLFANTIHFLLWNTIWIKVLIWDKRLERQTQFLTLNTMHQLYD